MVEAGARRDPGGHRDVPFLASSLAAQLRPVQLAHFALDVPLVPVDLEEALGQFVKALRRKTALDLISAHPDLKGFLAFGSQGPIGAGRAIEEKDDIGKVFVVGPLSPGQGRKLIKEGAVLGGFMWNPAEAGRVFVRVGKMEANGKEIKDGDTIEGLGVVHPDPKSKNIITNNLLQINKDTVDKLADLGL